MKKNVVDLFIFFQHITQILDIFVFINRLFLKLSTVETFPVTANQQNASTLRGTNPDHIKEEGLKGWCPSKAKTKAFAENALKVKCF